MVDEDMQSWYELYDWMWQLGNPESYNKRGRLSDEDNLINSVTSDASLFVKTNSNNPNIKVVFKDVYPVELGGLPFNSTSSQEFLTSSVTFAYTYYKIEI
jgi:hypothetical protein